MGWPVAADQSRTSPPRMRRSPVRDSNSSATPAVATIAPSGLNATALTRPAQLQSRAAAASGGNIPQPGAAVEAAGRQSPAIGAEGQREYRSRGDQRDRIRVCPRHGVPEPSGSVGSAGGDEAAIRAERLRSISGMHAGCLCSAGDAARRCRSVCSRLPPELVLRRAADRQEGLTIGAERDGSHLAGVWQWGESGRPLAASQIRASPAGVPSSPLPVRISRPSGL